MQISNSKNVLFIWEVPIRLKKYLNKHLDKISNLKLIFPQNISKENLENLASEANVIIGWRPWKKLLDHAPKLKLYINPGTGIQHLIPIFREFNSKQTNIILVNGHGNSLFVAQHVVGTLISLMNKIILHHNWMKEGKWRTGDEQGKSTSLWKKKVGLLGYGAINQKVHQLLLGFQCNFSILKRSWSNPNEPLISSADKYQPNQILDFMKKIDICIVAVPQTAKTIDLIGRKELELLGKEGYLVNVARGKIINEKDLYECLEAKVISGAAIDVWYNYQPEEDKEGKKFPYYYPFHTLDNIVLSPHRAASPFDNLERWDEVIENLKKIANNQTDFLNVVDLETEY
ncbi:NAD(P)-dependent oxidoreductase [Promethearchaeum syntrophicum]|uniref:NAD(P)-dependent oxidoreductase n=1 Tax=Promethearchaeum syntrophicum TaxID=2594042 RepID=A0A5B9DH31_9ARCH|nr:NAD(P)-dependent oxidoreductase [Candidatus Prometheoarchaeum syntrophicum]QEE18060.1 D-2-hydroxyacid dehydrogenase [Candidatus Prometheoarchaeum syntrophicum]